VADREEIAQIAAEYQVAVERIPIWLHGRRLRGGQAGMIFQKVSLLFVYWFYFHRNKSPLCEKAMIFVVGIEEYRYIFRRGQAISKIFHQSTVL
jgi:hypothetical protein